MREIAHPGPPLWDLEERCLLDLQAGPLRRLAEVYGDIRSGRFKPDLSRSGYYDCQSFDAPTHRTLVSPAPGTWPGIRGVRTVSWIGIIFS